MKTLTKRKFLSAIVMLFCVCLLSPISADADTVSLKLNSVSPGEPVSIHFGTLEGSYWAGIYNITLSGGSDPWNGDFQAFCVEDTAITPGTYSGYSLYSLDVDAAYKNAAWLMDNYLGDVASASDPSYVAASLQVAIWEAITDSSSFDLDTGNFIYYSGLLDTGLVTQYLNDLSSAISTNLNTYDFSNYRIVADREGPGQGGTQDYVAAVPIPSAVLLLASGLLGLFGIRRLKK